MKYPALMNAKFIEVGSIGRIQLSTAVILRVFIVIRHSFAAQIVVGAQHPARYLLRTALVAAVMIGEAFILAQK
jgi:hypothetical protein